MNELPRIHLINFTKNSPNRSLRGAQRRSKPRYMSRLPLWGLPRTRPPTLSLRRDRPSDPPEPCAKAGDVARSRNDVPYLCGLSIKAYLILFIWLSIGFTNVFAETNSKTKIGALLALSGNFAALGVDNRQGIEIGLSELGTPNIELIFADSKAEATTAVNEFKKMVETNNVSGMFAFRGPVGMAVSPLSARGKIPLLGGVGNKDFAELNPYAFQLWPRSDIEGQFLAEELNRLGHNRIALVTLEDDWTSAVSSSLRASYKASGSKIVFDQEVSPTETDFRTILTQVRKSEAKAVFLNLGLAQLAPALRQLREQRISIPIFSNFWAPKKEVVEAAGVENIEGVMFVEMQTNMPGLAEASQRMFGTNPSGATLSGYLATMLLGQAARGSETSLSSAELYARLLAQTEIRTINGNFPIKNRCVQFPLKVKIIRSGKSVILK